MCIPAALEEVLLLVDDFLEAEGASNADRFNTPMPPAKIHPALPTQDGSGFARTADRTTERDLVTTQKVSTISENATHRDHERDLQMILGSLTYS